MMDTFRDAVLRRLAASTNENFYALAEGAHFVDLGTRLSTSGETVQWRWLFEATFLNGLRHSGPILMWFHRLPEGSVEFLDWLIARDQHEVLVSWLWSGEQLDTVATHLAELLFTKLPDGRRALLRYYDPRVRRALESILSAEQRAVLMGPISRWQVWLPLQMRYRTFAQQEGGASEHA